MKTNTNYETMLRKELLEIAKKLAIKNRHSKTKGELVLAIREKEQIKDARDGSRRSTLDYAEKAQAGVLVAFFVSLGGKKRVLSAKVIQPNENGAIVVETKNGSKYRVLLEDIIWVKTGERWPRWVIEMYKEGPVNVN